MTLPAIQPCKACGGTPTAQMCPDEKPGVPSQYVRMECTCGAVGEPSWYFKGCGLEDTTDDERAIMFWNAAQVKP